MRGWNLKITLRRHGVASTKTVDESVVEAFRTSSNISTHEKVATQKRCGWAHRSACVVDDSFVTLPHRLVTEGDRI